MYGLDLFSGIGGITKALDGYVQPVAYCDNEPYARGVLLSRMHSGDIPVAPIWDDVSTLRGAMFPRIDIIYGGFPCQDISVAGRQVGLGGERSDLFFEIVRLARETKAEWIFLENVPNIRTKGLGLVLQTLAHSGYDCRWSALSAADVGANHKRERWFLLAHASSGTRLGAASGQTGHAAFGGKDVADSACRARQRPTQGKTRHASLSCENVAHHDQIIGQGKFVESELRPTDRNWWSTEPNVGRVAHGIPKRVDRLRALGNAVVPAQAREAFERLMGLKK